MRLPQRRRRLDPDTGRYRRLSRAQKEVNTSWVDEPDNESASTFSIRTCAPH